MRIFYDDKLSPQQPHRQKEKLGLGKLPSALKYLTPDRQTKYLKNISITGIVLSFLWLIDLALDQAAATTAGPLASAHANFGNDCSKCHDTFANAASEKCSACHEQSVRTEKQFGIYDFAAHYVYRSGDPGRAKLKRTADLEQPCRTCHVEHKGRDAKIMAVANAQCTLCHDYGAFTDEHPQFELIRNNVPDDSALAFTHIRHVREVLKQEKSVDTETACLWCHNPQFNGKLFQPIAYDKHCSNCHLQGVDTPPVPLMTQTNAGVQDIPTIRKIRTVATLWADGYDPNSFELRPGNRIIKKRMMHRDPWVIYNLNALAMPQNELMQLASSAGELNAFVDIQSQMRMALKSLSGSGNPDLQRQLAQADSVLLRLNVPDSMLWNAPGSNQNDAIAQKLSQPCQECHTLNGGLIAWVDGRQNKLIRANFNHRAHIVQRKCLDCHSRIVINPIGADSLQAIAGDRSGVQNLPGKETCIKCHDGNQTTQRCTTCHEFHI